MFVIKASTIFNSRREKTIRVDIKNKKIKVWAAAPSGVSIGRFEAKNFPKGGVEESVRIINSLSNKLREIKIVCFDDLKKIEDVLNKNLGNVEKIGANGIFALESAILKAVAAQRKEELWQIIGKKKKIPVPLANVIGGGKHSKEIAKPDFQEFLIRSNGNIEKMVEKNKEIYEKIGKELEKTPGFKKKKSDENAWIAGINNERAIEIIKDCCRGEGKVKVGVDVAGSSLFDGKKYKYIFKNLSPKEQLEYISELISKYKLFYVEDAFEERDSKNFEKLLKLNRFCLVCGDDLTATNVDRLKENIGKINCVIVKPNQIGSLIATYEFVKMAKEKKIKTVISHRSGETMDNTIAHLGVGWNVDYIKTGVIGKEREAKLNELIRIEKN